MFYVKDCTSIYSYHQASGDVSERVAKAPPSLRIEVSLSATEACDFNEAACSMEPKLELTSAPKLAMTSLKSPNDGCTTTAVVLSVADHGRLYGFALRPAFARAVLLRGTVSLWSTDSAVDVAVDRPARVSGFILDLGEALLTRRHKSRLRGTVAIRIYRHTYSSLSTTCLLIFRWNFLCKPLIGEYDGTSFGRVCRQIWYLGLLFL